MVLKQSSEAEPEQLFHHLLLLVPVKMGAALIAVLTAVWLQWCVRGDGEVLMKHVMGPLVPCVLGVCFLASGSSA